MFYVCVDFLKGVINNALWISRWKVTEHKNQDSSVKLILSGKETGHIHHCAPGALNTSSLRMTWIYFHLARKRLRWKYPWRPLWSSPTNHGLTQKWQSPRCCTPPSVQRPRPSRNHRTLPCVAGAFIARAIKWEFMTQIAKQAISQMICNHV